MKKYVYFLHPDTIFRDKQTGSGVYCGEYDVTEEQIKFGHCAYFGAPIQIDQGKINQYENSPERLAEKKKEAIKAQLAEIDSKKIRALTDFALKADKTRLQQLETQAEELRTLLNA